MSEADAGDPRPVGSDSSGAGQKTSRRAGAPHSVALSLEAGLASKQDRPRGRQWSRADAASIKPVAPSDADQLARAVADLEKASAALRLSQPALEPSRPGLEPCDDTRAGVLVWKLIGGLCIWVSAILVLSAAIGAVFYLFG
jgi:hypothetical protein